jgi:hypothetical protein
MSKRDLKIQLPGDLRINVYKANALLDMFRKRSILMRHAIIGIAAAILIVAASPALAGSCPKHMREIDAFMETKPDVSMDMLGKAKELRAEGEAMHKAGKHAESVAALAEAKKLLGMK